MFKRLGKRIYWVLPLAAFLLGFLGRTLFYYQGVYFAPNVPTDEVELVDFAVEAQQDPLAVAPTLSGTVLVDAAHQNKYYRDESSLFLGRITALGGQVEYYNGDDPLAEALHGKKGFVVVANVLSYTLEEALAVEEFVNDGGRVVIVGDPTRLADAFSLNSLAGHFGIIFQDDYIYNLVENDGSYLNVYLRDFEENTLTEGVDELVLRAAHSLRASEGVLARGDENTFSSLREVPGDVAAIALTNEGNVLALPDLTFMIPPYNSFGDNDHFIDNIVGFLLNGERSFELLDFPQIFSGEVQLVFDDSQLLADVFEESTALRQMLEASGAEVLQNNSFLGDQAAVIVGLYADVDSATRNLLLADDLRLVSAGGGLVSIPDVGDLSQTGSVLFHLHRTATGTYQLIILGEDPRALRGGLQVLVEGRLGDCLLHPNTALCMPGVIATPSPTPTTTRTTTPDGTTSPDATLDGSVTPTLDGSVTPTPTATETPSG